jgi:hypothetical protein
MTDISPGQADEAFRCADDSFERDEPMFATASQVERWLLIEQEGPFSGESVPAGRISPQVLTYLSRLVRAERARLVLIRRPSGVETEAGLRVYYADVRAGQERLLTMLVADEAALTGLTLSDPGWTPVIDPIYLVCTHGKHDPCCAVKGRPVAYALAEALAPRRVWECSHVGGDRFAGNMVALPSGLYLGRVEPDEVSAVAELIDSGRVPVHYLRGRSSLSTEAQAAQHFAHTVGGLSGYDHLDDLLPHRTIPAPDDGDAAWTIELNSPEGPVRVTVRRTMSAQTAQLTCHSPEPKNYPQFELVRLERGSV